jgi:uncharacterized repeat protein (TIGR03803 family)
VQILNRTQCTLGTIAAAALVGCGASQGIVPQTPGAASMNVARTVVRGASAPSYGVLYRFANGPDGAYPYAGLVSMNGTLYGTTYGGGRHGRGTVFSVTRDGTEKVLYSFRGDSDGAAPYANLINVNGTLYGTTMLGGGSRCYVAGCGTVFSVTTSGTEHVLHRFHGGSDGKAPYAGLVDLNGTLYGTTTGGGSADCYLGCGTVFSVTTSGTERVLYRFRGGFDGADPSARLIRAGGVLYGTTSSGGSGCTAYAGCGTVFRVTTNGAETVLYRFHGGSDGQEPVASLIDVKGVLYGTTRGSGPGKCHLRCGTVFSVTRTGTETVLYRFRGGSDGAGPTASLIDLNGTLYGTTANGGGSGDCYFGCGTVFSVTTAGVESVLHSFAGGSDGGYANANLIDVHGTVYGTTYGTGIGSGGNGTVFALTP